MTDLAFEFVTRCSAPQAASRSTSGSTSSSPPGPGPGEPRIVEPEKCADLRWCRLDDAARPGGAARAHVLDCGAAGYRRAVPDLRFRLREEQTMSEDLGPKPEPETEPAEPNPGGAGRDRRRTAVTAGGRPRATCSPTTTRLSRTTRARRDRKVPDDTSSEATTDGATEPDEGIPCLMWVRHSA